MIAEWVVAGYYRAFEAVESELGDLDASVMSASEDVAGDLARLVEIRRLIGTLRRRRTRTPRSWSRCHIPT